MGFKFRIKIYLNFLNNLQFFSIWTSSDKTDTMRLFLLCFEIYMFGMGELILILLYYKNSVFFSIPTSQKSRYRVHRPDQSTIGGSTHYYKWWDPVEECLNPFVIWMFCSRLYWMEKHYNVTFHWWCTDWWLCELFA